MKELPLIQAPPLVGDDSDLCCSDDACCAVPGVGEPVGAGTVSDGSLRSVVRVDGMDCASCAVTLERVVRSVPGVSRAVVNFGAARMDVHHDERVSDTELAAAVGRAGFTVREAGAAERPTWWRSRRAVLLAAATALSAVAVVGSWDSEDVAAMWVAVFVAALALSGWPVFRAAWVGVRARHLDMNVLMAAATAGAAVLGQWPEAVAIVLLFSLGNLLQVHAMERTRASVAALADLAPSHVRVLGANNEAREVPVEAVRVGKRVLIRPGERVALDGIIVNGATTMDESPITGESIPVEKTDGDRVLSGSLNGSGSVTIRVDQPAERSTVQRIAQMVEQAQTTKAPSEHFVERFSRLYTPIVVGAAILLAIVPGFVTDDWATWVYRSLALLIIACPCSLVISTPVTVVSGIGAASRRGILIKGGAALEAAGRIDALALDKTGTLTEGRPTLVSTSASKRVDPRDALRIAAALEYRSEHPLAHAIVTAADLDEIPSVENFQSVAGRGATGTLDATHYVVGSPRLFAERDIELNAEHEATLAAMGSRGETPVLLGTNERLLAIFGLADTIRPDAPSAIATLRATGIKYIVMLTGDSSGAARRVADELGIAYQAELLPEHKVEAMRRLARDYGTAGMVGDGVNDAPALAAATVSFAMGAAGSGVALQSADVALMQDDLRKLGEAVALSRATDRILRQNIIASLVIKGAFVLLAPFGLVTLWLAVAADMGTSFGVTANGLRLFRRGRS